jgi:hypothetical protein
MKKYRAEHQEERKAYDKQYFTIDENRERKNANVRRWAAVARSNNRQKVLDVLGDRCVCCGFRDPDFLTIDHIRRGGTEHRKITGGRMWEAVLREGCPTDKYRILCWSCNNRAGRTLDNECPCGVDCSTYV